MHNNNNKEQKWFLQMKNRFKYSLIVKLEPYSRGMISGLIWFFLISHSKEKISSIPEASTLYLPLSKSTDSLDG